MSIIISGTRFEGISHSNTKKGGGLLKNYGAFSLST